MSNPERATIECFTSLDKMLLLLASAVFAAYEDVPLTNENVVAVKDYAIAAIRTLFPEAPATGEYPLLVAAALQGTSGTDILLHIRVVQDVDLNLTIYRDVKGANQITEIHGHTARQAPPEDYQWEAVTALSASTLTLLKTHLAAAPYSFDGEIATVLAYRSQRGGGGGGGGGGAGGQQNHHAIFLDASRVAHSVVFHSTGGFGTPSQELTVSSFKTVE
jgi:hypothetical protein